MAVQITTKLTGADNVQVGLRTFAQAAPDLVKQDVRDAMQNARNEYKGSEAGGYSVPEVYGQTYQRTGDLDASTYVEENGLSFTFKSEAISPEGVEYSVSVLGNAAGQGQGRNFVGRWPLVRDVIRKWALTLTENVRARLKLAAAGLGLGSRAA